MSGTGRCKGFTLVEIMVATAILSVGALLVHQPFFKAIETFEYYRDYMNILPFMNEKMWRTQDAISAVGIDAGPTNRGVERIKGTDFRWFMYYDVIDRNGSQELCRIDLHVMCRSGSRMIELTREGYAIYTFE